MNEMCNILNSELTKIQEWLYCNKLSLNIKKTSYMVFGPKNKKVNSMDIYLNNTVINRVYVTKFLGVQIDASLTWRNHIDFLCKKLAKCAAIFIKARKVLDKSTLINLYYSFAYPYLIYCNHIWGNTYPTCLEKLNLMHKRIIRVITCSPYRAHTAPLFYANRILTLKDINVYTACIFVFNYLDGALPNTFDNYYVTNRDIHNRDTRNADDLHIPYGRLDNTISNIRINGSKLWNNLSPYIKNSTSIYIFKSRLRFFLIEQTLVS